MLELVLATANPHKVDELRAIFSAHHERPAQHNEAQRHAAGPHRRPLQSSDLPALSVIGLCDLPTDVRARLFEPAEHGSTFEENAAIKALSYAEQTGRLCLADDSGLEVDALDGRPGVISSHYFNDGAETHPATPRAERDRLNNERLLRDLTHVPDAQRTARFVCVMALAAPASLPMSFRGTGVSPVSVSSAGARLLFSVRGTFEGRIGTPPHIPRGSNGFGYDPLFLVAPDHARTSAELSPEEKNRLSHRGQAAHLFQQRFAALLNTPESA